MFQFGVENERLSCMVFQRSADLFLGFPYDISAYALLTVLVARQLALSSGQLTIAIGDAHIYLNHLAQVDNQLTRSPLPLPRIAIRGDASLFDVDIDDVELSDYQSHPPIRAPLNF